jgi:hypothetical protein
MHRRTGNSTPEQVLTDLVSHDQWAGAIGAVVQRCESLRCVRSLGFVVPDRLAGLNLTVVGLL